MKTRTLLLSSCLSAFLIACGGEQDASPPSKYSGRQFFATETAVFSGPRSNYTLTKTSPGYMVIDNVGSEGTRTITDVQALKFSDVTVNLTITSKASTITPANLTSLIELYIAFFNRVPDADGLEYWIDQFNSGMSIDQIADSFYNAAVQYTSLTGYSPTMTNADFVRVIYKNVLGRSGATAPPDADVNYWVDSLASGAATKGSLVKAMLSSAHSFKGDGTWGWVADLLDNKATVASHFAIQEGLTYNTSSESISKGMAIAAAVTSTNMADAIALIGQISSTSILSIKSGNSFTYIRKNSSQSVRVPANPTGATAPINTTTTYWTKEFQNVNSDGSHTLTSTFSNGSYGVVQSISADGSLLSRTGLDSARVVCTYLGNNVGSVPPFAVGQKWDNSWTWNCSSGETGSGTNIGSIVGIESVTVPAGTFSAYKEVFTRTRKNTAPSRLTFVDIVTCWRDVVLLQHVKCESTTTYTTMQTTGTTTFTLKESQVLDSHVINGVASGVPWTSRFAGAWTMQYSGTASGTCTFHVTDSTTSSTAVLGRCSSSDNTKTYTMFGGMNAHGSARFSPATDGAEIVPIFSAQFTSAAKVSGTWSLGQASGTWTATHD